jgi:DNA-binding Xre family transcriptional regulator
MKFDRQLLDEARAFMATNTPRSRGRASIRGLDFLYDALHFEPAPAAAAPAPEDEFVAAAGLPLTKIGEGLRALREEAGMTLSELEERTGISCGRLSRIETGVAANPTLDTLERIAAGLGVQLRMQLRERGAG